MAYNGFHRSVKAGVALAGAGAIAFAAVPAPTPLDDVTVAAPAAFVNPAPRVVTTEIEPVVLATALQILATGAVQAVQESVHALQYDTVAIFDRVVEQWPDINLTPWNHSLVAAALLAPVAPLLVGPFNYAVADAVAQVFPQYGDQIREDLPEAVQYAFARIVGPFLSAFGATGAVHQDYYHAGMAGDRLGQNLALLNAPAKIIEAFLNGGYGDLGPLLTGDPDAPRQAAPGLLTPWGQWPTDRNVIVVDDDVPDNEFITLTLDAAAAEETSADATGTVEVVEASVEPAEAEVIEADEVAVEAAETVSDKPTGIDIRKSLQDFSDDLDATVKKLTGADREAASEETAGTEDTKSDDKKSEDKKADAEKAESKSDDKTEKSDKADKSESSASDKSDSE